MRRSIHTVGNFPDETLKAGRDVENWVKIVDIKIVNKSPSKIVASMRVKSMRSHPENKATTIRRKEERRRQEDDEDGSRPKDS